MEVQEMKRISISFVSTVFALFALAICVYSLFYYVETATKTQGIYWFCIALVAAIVPHRKDLAPYIKRVKVSDVEVELNELKKEVQAVKNDIKKLDKVMMQLSKVSEKEASLSPEFREFGKTFMLVTLSLLPRTRLRRSCISKSLSRKCI